MTYIEAIKLLNKDKLHIDKMFYDKRTNKKVKITNVKLAELIHEKNSIFDGITYMDLDENINHSDRFKNSDMTIRFIYVS